MKKLIVTCLLSLMIFTALSTVSASEKLKTDESQIDKFYSKMQTRELKENEGNIVIDTVNHQSEKQYNEYNDVKVSKKAIMFSLINQTDEEITLLLEKVKNKDESKIKEKTIKLDKLLKKEKDKFSEIYMLLDELNLVEESTKMLARDLKDNYIYDSNGYESMTTYYYQDIEYGYFEDYDKTQTKAGLYTKQAEYYKNYLYSAPKYNYPSNTCPSNTMNYSYVSYGNDCKIYSHEFTGNIRYLASSTFGTYPHKPETFTFNYQSYDLLGDDRTAPYAEITLINDYWGNEKMYITSDVIGVPFKITKEAHYSRNDYNKINGISVDTLYPTEASIDGAGFEDESEQGTYFHKLLTSNTGNVKYTKNVEYYNLNADRYSNGSNEIVYKSDGTVEYEDLVTFSFNFGDRDTYPDGALLAYDSHWILDVYPYLIWGNSQVDADNHSAFERFVWDKDSAKAAYDFPLVPDYECRDLQRNELIEMYVDADTCGEGCLGNADATPIPDSVQDGRVLFYDSGDPYFDVITTKHYSELTYSYNKDWTVFINNEFDNSLDFSNLIYLEVSDPVNFTNPGTYYVTVALKDQDSNQFNRTFKVIISSC